MLNELALRCHEANKKWWQDPATGYPITRNKGEMIALMHSELSEILEAERKDLSDTHLPHRRGAEVELSDLLIRLLDYSAAYGYDLDGAFEEKMAYNKTRADHTLEARMQPGGKKF